MGKYEGKVVLVTGAGSGFGSAAARRFAAEGAKVALLDRNTESVTSVAEEVDGYAIVGDVTDADVSTRAVFEVEEHYGRLDVAFLNAGTVGGQPASDDLLDLQRYRAVRRVNLDAVVYGTCAAVPALRRAGGGDVIATASLAGLVAIPEDPVYTLTKHGVVGYVKAVGAQLAGSGVRVNAVCPGFADTPLIKASREAFIAAEFPLLTADDVVDALELVLAADGTGECWYVQPGRESEPFRFRNVPGPRRGVVSQAPPTGALHSGS